MPLRVGVMRWMLRGYNQKPLSPLCKAWARMFLTMFATILRRLGKI